MHAVHGKMLVMESAKIFKIFYECDFWNDVYTTVGEGGKYNLRNDFPNAIFGMCI